MTSLVPLNIYGIGIEHPVNWQLYFNPSNELNFDEGLVKIDKVDEEKKASTSLTLRWAKMNGKISLDEYIEELHTQFTKKEKRSRNKDKYQINDVVKYEVDGKEAYLIKNEFIANHSIYRILGKDEMVKVLQLITFSEDTERIIIASLSTTPEELKQNENYFIDILETLHEATHKTNEILYA